MLKRKSYLCDVHHVSHEGKALQFELGDVCLKQHIDLRLWTQEKKEFYSEKKRKKTKP